MRISKKTEYAVRAAVILASQAQGKSIQARDIAETGEIPHRFLEQILLTLKRSGLVASKRGAGGGYCIAKEARLISVAEVISSVEGAAPASAALYGEGSFTGAAGIDHCFDSANQAYLSVLENTSLEDLIQHDSGDSMVGFGI